MGTGAYGQETPAARAVEMGKHERLVGIEEGPPPSSPLLKCGRGGRGPLRRPDPVPIWRRQATDNPQIAGEVRLGDFSPWAGEGQEWGPCCPSLVDASGSGRWRFSG